VLTDGFISNARWSCSFFGPLVVGLDPLLTRYPGYDEKFKLTERSAEGCAVVTDPSLDSRPIYMDHHATTPVDDEVVSAMLPYFAQNFGNPSSGTHVHGTVAREATELAREKAAKLLNAASAGEIIFTGGATESDNLAIKGVAHRFSHQGRHIITSAIEHKAVLQPYERLETEGYRVTYLPVDQYGLVDPDSVRRAIAHDTILISIQYANSEIGIIQSLDMIGRLAREKKYFIRMPHKQRGRSEQTSNNSMWMPSPLGSQNVRPQRSRRPLCPQGRRPRTRTGRGAQERGYRAGTLNVTEIVGLGKICELARRDLESESKCLVALVRVNGHPSRRLPHNLNISFEYVDSEALIESLPEIALSAGSACTSQSKEPSNVLPALGLTENLALSAVRFGLGTCNTREQIDCVVYLIASSVKRLRDLSPLYAT
jgi:cysteine desulfurase